MTVNERLNLHGPSSAQTVQREKENDQLRLASELVELHYEFKAVHKHGRVDEQLRRGWEDVNRVLEELREL